ncbi:MAG TPA: hypothetical protein VFV41_23105 [Streptosporangiaceae bacterium]|nr:hypothetical protein [Streptosporangiaceae bacterium]
MGWKHSAITPGPCGLLRPDQHVVEFTGRVVEQTVLTSWCASAEGRSVRIIAGPGGSGKTRLALRAATVFEAGRGQWRLVPAGDEARAVAAARAKTPGPLLLVVDGAEARPELRPLLTAVLGDPGRIRVLLLARALGEWWGELIEQSEPAIRQLLTEAEPLQLARPVVPDLGDAELARAALPYFASALHLTVPLQVSFGLPAQRLPVLLLHAAALVAVLRSAAAPAAGLRLDITTGMLDELLEHEARYWQRSARAAGLSTDGAVLGQVTAAAALLGSPDPAETARVIARVPGLAGASRARRRSWAHWLHELYPPAPDGSLGSLQPALLAEAHITRQLAADPALARVCLRELTGEQASRVLTILARARWHTRGAGELIATALRADLEGLAGPAAQVARQASDGLGALLAAVLADAPCPPEQFLDLAATLPYPSAALAPAHLAAARRVAAWLRSVPPGAEPAWAAEWHGWAGSRLAQLGEPAEALEVIWEEVQLRRELAAADRSRHGHGLARALSGLAALLTDLGRDADAAQVREEAASLGG